MHGAKRAVGFMVCKGLQSPIMPQQGKRSDAGAVEKGSPRHTKRLAAHRIHSDAQSIGKALVRRTAS